MGGPVPAPPAPILRWQPGNPAAAGRTRAGESAAGRCAAGESARRGQAEYPRQLPEPSGDRPLPGPRRRRTSARGSPERSGAAPAPRPSRPQGSRH